MGGLPEFEWDAEKSTVLSKKSDTYSSIHGKLYTSLKPISPASGLRGITLYSRGKLVNLPEYFSESTSSHFFSYLTGWISIDFIEDFEEDVISTNRQSIVWDEIEMQELREVLKDLVSEINTDWRKRRKEKKQKEITTRTGIDTKKWVSTLPDSVKKDTQKIIETLGSEDVLEEFGSVIESLHRIIPEYAELHWRHLNSQLKGDVEDYYKNGMLGEAADQAVKLYFQRMREMAAYTEDGVELVGKVYRTKPFIDDRKPKIRLNNLQTDSEKAIQTGQAFLSMGIYAGFRNPVNHAPMKNVVPGLFSQMDCLNVLSLVSYLMTRLDSASVDPDI